MTMVDDELLARCAPPWVAFTYLEPDLFPRYVTQGETEWWYDAIWRPFWTSLTDTQKARYLDRWNASPGWRDALRSLDELNAIDLGADALESDLYLGEMRRKRAKHVRPGFWKRIFGSKK
jgi:hypothetical protein